MVYIVKLPILMLEFALFALWRKALLFSLFVSEIPKKNELQESCNGRGCVYFFLLAKIEKYRSTIK